MQVWFTLCKGTEVNNDTKPGRLTLDTPNFLYKMKRLVRLQEVFRRMIWFKQLKGIPAGRLAELFPKIAAGPCAIFWPCAKDS